MNQSYAVIYNNILDCYQVVSEITKIKKNGFRKVITVAAALLLSSAGATLTVNTGRTELNNAQEINSNLGEVVFNIQDTDIPSPSLLKNAINAFKGSLSSTDYNSVIEKLGDYQNIINMSIDNASLPHLSIQNDLALKVANTINVTSGHNVIISSDASKKLVINDSITPLFNNDAALMLLGTKNNPIAITNNKTLGNLISNTRDIYLENIDFLNNEGVISNAATGTMIFDNVNFNEHKGLLISNSGTLVIKGGMFNKATGTFFTTSGTTIIDGTLFKENHNSGGATPSQAMIAVSGGITFINNTEFKNSNQRAVSTGSNTSKLIITNSWFEDLSVGTNNAGAVDGYMTSFFHIIGSTFKNNFTSYNGGAVAFVANSASQQNRLFKNNTFIGNRAAADGGAIYAYRDFTIAVDKEKTSLFMGNLSNDNGSAGVANSISSPGRNVNLVIDGTLDMRDPMYKLANLIKDGKGVWKLGGNNTSISNIFINEGELYLYRDGEVDNANKYDNTAKVTAGNINLSGNFTLGSIGTEATLSIGGGNTIKASTIHLNQTGKDGGTTLNFTIDPSNTSNNYLLNLKGNVNAANKVTIDVNGITLGDTGLYGLMTTTGTEFDLNWFNLTIGGSDLLDTRYEGAYGLSFGNSGNDHKKIDLEFLGITNFVNTWTGASSVTPNLWDHIGAKNWSHLVTNQFANGDVVNFTADGAGQVEVADGVVSGAIYMSGDQDYLFDGTLTTDNTSSSNNLTTVANGKLTLGGKVISSSIVDHNETFTGTLDLTETINNDFKNGVDIHSGTLKISAENQLGTTLDQLKFLGAIDDKATLLIADGGDVKFENQMLTVDAGEAANITTEGTGDLTFKNNNNQSMIANNGNLTIVGTQAHKVLFDGAENVASSIINSGNLTLTHTTFRNSEDGAILVEAGSTTTITDSDFVNNRANGNGGAIFSKTSVVIKDSKFENNTAQSGGAIFSLAPVVIEDSKFVSNTAKNGGAIFVGSGVTTTVTDSEFIDNTAQSGGAIYINNGTLNLNAQDKDVIFSGNTANGVGNSIHLADNATLNIDVADGKKLDMQDAMSGRNDPGNPLTITKLGKGIWMLGGNSSFTGAGTTIFSITEGFLELAKGASIAIAEKNSSFVKFGGAGTTEISFNYGNIIDANVVFDTSGNTVLNFNMDGSTENSNNPLLDIKGTALITGNGNLNIALDQLSSAAGKYILVEKVGGDSFINKVTLLNEDSYKNGRFNSINFFIQEDEIYVEKDITHSGIATWKGNDGVWDSASHNWTVNDQKGMAWKQFASGDVINLTDAGSGTFNLTSTMKTAAIYVSGDKDYKIFEHGLVADSDAGNTTLGNVVANSGKLVLGKTANDFNNIQDASFTGTLDLTETVNNDFKNGVDIHSGTLKIAAKEQLGTTLDKLKLLGDTKESATLQIAKDASVEFANEQLKLANSDKGTLHLEEGADVAINNNGFNNIDVSGDLNLKLDENSRLNLVSDQANIDLTGQLNLELANSAKFMATNGLQGGNGIVNQSGTGTWQLGGNSSLAGGKLNIYGGTLALIKDAKIDLGTNGEINLGQAMLAVNGGNELAGDLKIDATGNGSVLHFNVDTSQVNVGTPLLDIRGDITITGASSNDKVQIDLTRIDLDSGNYGLLAANNGNLNLKTIHKDLTVKGVAIASINRLNNIQLIFGAAGESLSLDVCGLTNGFGEWVNRSGNSIWDISSNNWDITDANKQNWGTFIDGDKVQFKDGAGTHQNIIVDAGSSNKHVVNGMDVNSQYDYKFSGDSIELKNGQKLTKQNIGTLTLNNQVIGDVDLQQGSMIIGDSKANSRASIDGNVDVIGGVLGGHGVITGHVKIGSSATLSSGNSIGTLTVGSLDFLSGSRFLVDANSLGSADRVNVTQDVNISGGSRVEVKAQAGAWQPLTSYTIISAGGDVTGTFGDITTNLAFLTPTLTYDSDSVVLNLERNNKGFNSVGNTYNQIQTANAIEYLDQNHAVYKSIIGASAHQAIYAFDNLSGEIYASTSRALVQNAQHLQQQMVKRLGLRYDEISQNTNMPANSFWIDSWGYDGYIKGDQNAGKVDRKGYGLLMGYDFTLNSSTNTILGAAIGYEDTKVQLKDSIRNSENKVKSIHLMAYAGTQLSGINLKTGINYSNLRFKSARNIRVGGLESIANASYRGHQLHMFLEASRTFYLTPSIEFEPYANLAYTMIKSNSFTERDSLAALRHRGESNHYVTSTIGMRNALRFGSDYKYALTTDLAWQHNFGHKFTKSHLGFVGGVGSFNVKSPAIGRNSALIGVGFNAKDKNFEFDVGYRGKFGNKLRDHGATLRFTWSF